MDGQLRAGSSDDLLLLGSRELTQDRLSDRSGRLDRQGVHEHVRSGSHGGQLAREFSPGREAELNTSFCTRNCRPEDGSITPIPLLLVKGDDVKRHPGELWRSRWEIGARVAAEVGKGAKFPSAKLLARWSRAGTDTIRPPSAITAFT